MKMRKKLLDLFKKAVKFILNPRLLLCFGIAWMITNGWSYVMLAVGTAFGIGWMIALSSAYLTILWLPSPEKIVTCAIAILLLRLLFPKDQYTLGVLRDMRDSAINAFKNRKRMKKDKKNAQKQASDIEKQTKEPSQD